MNTFGVVHCLFLLLSAAGPFLLSPCAHRSIRGRSLYPIQIGNRSIMLTFKSTFAELSV